MTPSASRQPNFNKIFNEAFDAIGRINIAVFGKTGVGKSTLVNSFFGVDIAATGIGSPVTADLTYYEVPNRPFGLYDSQGFETGESSDEILDYMQKVIKHSRKGDSKEQIHAVWYCVRSADKRFEQSQVDFVRKLIEIPIPVIVVMTQVPRLDGEFDPEALELEAAIRQNFSDPPTPADLVKTNAKRNAFIGVERHGLDDLLDATGEVIPEALKKALIAAQQVDIGRKRVAAQGVIAAAAGAAATAALIPIPLADMAALLPVEMGMFASVAAIYGIPTDAKRTLKLATTVIVGHGVRQIGGRALLQLVSAVPGVNIAANVIQASVAGAFTYAAGSAWMVVCEQLLKHDANAIGRALEDDEMVKLFQDAFRKSAKRKPPESF